MHILTELAEHVGDVFAVDNAIAIPIQNLEAIP